MRRWQILRNHTKNTGNSYHVSDLAGIKELAEMLNVPKTTITTWNIKQSLYFADPIVVFGNGPLFSRNEYMLSWEEWQPKKGAKTGELSTSDKLRLSNLIGLTDEMKGGKQWGSEQL